MALDSTIRHTNVTLFKSSKNKLNAWPLSIQKVLKYYIYSPMDRICPSPFVNVQCWPAAGARQLTLSPSVQYLASSGFGWPQVPNSLFYYRNTVLSVCFVLAWVLRVNSDDLSAPTSDQQYPIQSLCQDLQELHVWHHSKGRNSKE